MKYLKKKWLFIWSNCFNRMVTLFYNWNRIWYILYYYLAIMKLLVTKIEYYRLKDNNETIKNSLYFLFYYFHSQIFPLVLPFSFASYSKTPFFYLEMSNFHLQKSWKILNLYLFCYDHYTFLFHILSMLQFLHLWLK